ncbi:MAG: PKD domain-containing protein [Paludibacter sp.]|nr:PKD domain-containing protein [Paludibacter sp.]
MRQYPKLTLFVLIILCFCSNVFGVINVYQNLFNAPVSNNSSVVWLADAAVGGSIDGTTTVCQNDSAPVITFTGSGGVAPYTFTYKINNGNYLTCVTQSNSSTVTIAAPTNVAGTFTYTLASVYDATNTSQSTSGTAVITVNEQPNINLLGSGSGDTFNGIPVFKTCANSVYTFTFSNGSTSQSKNANYIIKWGDNTPDMNVASWTSKTHTYGLGRWDLTYTIIGKNGCIVTKQYIVFVGSNPNFTLDNTINTDICGTSIFSIPINGTSNNPPGTLYTVTFNDGSTPQVFSQPPPAQITHVFNKSSCGTTSVVGGQTYANAFAANILVSNPCGKSSANVAPIYVSMPPKADYSVSRTVNCAGTPLCFTNTSTDAVDLINNAGVVTCSTSVRVVWSITPSNGVTLSSGTLGSDNGSTDNSLWTVGSNGICPVFSIPGTYTIKMKVGNRCGFAEKDTVICIEPTLNPLFTLSSNSGCAPFSVTTTNNTDISKSCSTPSYQWSVVYTASNCGTSSSYAITSGSASSANPSFVFNNPGTYTLKLSTTNSCGTQSASQVINVTKPPTVTIDTIPDVCGAGVITPTALISTCTSTPSSVSYLWNFPGGNPATSTLASPGNITYNAVEKYTVRLTITNECGVSSTVTRDFSVNAIPVLANTTLAQTVCSGNATDSVKLTATAPATTFTWTATATAGLTGFKSSGSNSIPSQTILNSNATVGTVTYAITPKLGNCVGTTTNYVITVNPNPTISTQPLSHIYCKDEVANTLSATVTGGLGKATHQWYSNTVSDNTTGTLLVNDTAATYVPSTSTVGTMYYYCVIGYPQICATALTTSVATIAVNPNPVISTKNTVICSGNSFTVTPTTSNGDIVPTGTTYTWTDPLVAPVNSVSGAAAQLLPQTAISQILTNNTINSATVAYTVTPTSGSCVGVPFQVIVTLSPAIKPNVTVRNVTCLGAGNGVIKTFITGGTPHQVGAPYSVSWTGPNGYTSNDPDSITGLKPGAYQLTITDAGLCPSTTNYTVVEPADLSLQTVTKKNVGCFGSANGQISIKVTGGTMPYTYSWTKDNVAFATTQNIANLGPGVYTVTINDLYGCGPKMATYTITESPVMTLGLVNQTNNTCFGDAKGAITITTSGGNPFEVSPGIYDYHYSWVGPNGFKSTSQNLINIRAGVYNLTVADSSDCNKSLTVTITEPVELVVNTTTTPISCFGANNASITASISGGLAPYQIVWSNSGSGLVQNNLPAGDYVVSVTDANFCQKTVHINIPEAAVLAINPVVKKISCNGANDGSINLNITGATNPMTVVWDDATAGVIRSNLMPGTYTVRINANSTTCSLTRSFTLTDPLPLAISTTHTNNVCFGDALGTIDVNVSGGRKMQVSPGVLDYKYAWTGPGGFTSTLQNLKNIRAGKYDLIVTDSTSCTISTSVTITETPEIKITAVTTPIGCKGANNATISISLSGGVPPYTTQWSNLGTGLSQTDLSAGDYLITVTDANLCVKTLLINIPEAAELAIAPVVKRISCFGANNGSINLNLTGGTNATTVIWDDGNTSTTRNNLAPGSYTVKINAGTPCYMTRTFIIAEPQPLALSANVINAFDCSNANSGFINLLVSGGTPPFSYAWSNGAKTEDLVNIPAGSYTVMVTDSSGCSETAQYNVIRQQQLVVSTTDVLDFNCTTKKIKQVSTAHITGGIPPYQISWSSGTVSGTNNEIMESAENGMVVLTVSDNLGCTTTKTVNVTIPKLGIDYALQDCNNRIYIFNALVLDEVNDFYTYLWNFGDGTTSSSKTPQHTFAAPGSYNVVLTVAGTNCTTNYSVTINAGQLPVLSIYPEPKICFNDSLVLHVIGAETYRWNNGTTGDSLMIKTAGDYSVVGTSKSGCTSILNFTATYFDSYNYTIMTDRNEVTSDPVPLHLWTQDIPGSQYSWDFGDGEKGNGLDLQHTYKISKDGFFDVVLRVINPNGCVETANKRIWNTSVALPNSFTPNGDGKNDIFLKGWHIQVFNRNGILIYDGSDGWDGKYKGQPVSADTYYFLMYYTTEKGVRSNAGYVTVIR